MNKYSESIITNNFVTISTETEKPTTTLNHKTFHKFHVRKHGMNDAIKNLNVDFS